MPEHAKHTGELTAKKLAGKWTDGIWSITFSSSGRYHSDNPGDPSYQGAYEIYGNFVILDSAQGSLYYSPKTGKLISLDGNQVYHK